MELINIWSHGSDKPLHGLICEHSPGQAKRWLNGQESLSSEDGHLFTRRWKGKSRTAGTGSEMRCANDTQVVPPHFLFPPPQCRDVFIQSVNCFISHASLNELIINARKWTRGWRMGIDPWRFITQTHSPGVVQQACTIQTNGSLYIRVRITRWVEYNLLSDTHRGNRRLWC